MGCIDQWVPVLLLFSPLLSALQPRSYLLAFRCFCRVHSTSQDRRSTQLLSTLT